MPRRGDSVWGLFLNYSLKYEILMVTKKVVCMSVTSTLVYASFYFPYLENSAAQCTSVLDCT